MINRRRMADGQATWRWCRHASPRTPHALPWHIEVKVASVEHEGLTGSRQTQTYLRLEVQKRDATRENPDLLMRKLSRQLINVTCGRTLGMGCTSPKGDQPPQWQPDVKAKVELGLGFCGLYRVSQ